MIEKLCIFVESLEWEYLSSYLLCKGSGEDGTCLLSAVQQPSLGSTTSDSFWCFTFIFTYWASNTWRWFKTEMLNNIKRKHPTLELEFDITSPQYMVKVHC
jgi:hypothetical protein